MKVGVVRFTQSWSIGGGSQVETVLLDALREVGSRGKDEIVFLVRPDQNLRDLVESGLLSYGDMPLQQIGLPSYDQGPLEFYLAAPRAQTPTLDLNKFYFDYTLNQDLRDAAVDWLFQLFPSPMAFSALKPFVMPVFDLQHRLQPEFPEVSEDGETIKRDYLYQNACRFATLLIVDSEQGRRDLLNFFGDFIDSDRIRVLQFYPPIFHRLQPSDADVKKIMEKYKLPGRYFFYPAQFWRHKNHRLIIEAIRRIEVMTGDRIPVVFCGSYMDRLRAINFKDVFDCANELGVRDLIHYLGWVPDAYMPALYVGSCGLVMPTFFGPSNIPPLEAWYYGRPVITSDLDGIREQTGDGGLLINPHSSEQLADAMLRLWKDDTLAQQLAANGQRKLASYNWPTFVDSIADIVTEVSARVREGRTPRYPVKVRV